jgi:hypothetical protein
VKGDAGNGGRGEDRQFDPPVRKFLRRARHQLMGFGDLDLARANQNAARDFSSTEQHRGDSSLNGWIAKRIRRRSRTH